MSESPRQHPLRQCATGLSMKRMIQTGTIAMTLPPIQRNRPPGVHTVLAHPLKQDLRRFWYYRYTTALRNSRYLAPSGRTTKGDYVQSCYSSSLTRPRSALAIQESREDFSIFIEVSSSTVFLNRLCNLLGLAL